MSAVGFPIHHRGLSRGIRFLYLISAVYMVFALTICGSLLLARDLTTNPLGTGSGSTLTYGSKSDQGASHFEDGHSSHGGSPVQSPWPKRLRGVLETKDGASTIFAVAPPSDGVVLGTDAPDPVSKISFAQPEFEDHVLDYYLLRRPPPAN